MTIFYPRTRYRYETENAVLIGNMWQIAEYVGKNYAQLKVEKRMTGNPEKLTENDLAVDFVNYKTGFEGIGVPYADMKMFVPNIKSIFAHYTYGHTYRNGVKIVAIKRRPLEVHNAERH